jgi:hypothetical protein
MAKLKIKFSHQYPKLYRQATAELVKVKISPVSDLAPAMVEYDTMYFEDGKETPSHFPLPPSGIFLILYFIGNLGIPFTTIRRISSEKHRHYNANIGNIFQIVLIDEPEQEEKKKDTSQLTVFDQAEEKSNEPAKT